MVAPMHNTPFAYLIALAIVLCIIHALTHCSFFESWRMHPYSIFRGNRMFTVLTSLFVHVDGMHLLINTGMLCLTLPEAIHLYGALAGVLFAFAVRPQAINEVTDIICSLMESEKGNDESSRYNHSGEHSEYCTIEKSIFAAFASLKSI